MRLHIIHFVITLAMITAVPFSFGDPADAPPLPAEPGPEARIASVLVREKDVLATDSMVLYRGSPADKHWRAVRTPADMPLLGAFVVPPPGQAGSDTVFFCAPPPEAALVIDDPKTGATHLVTGDAARGNQRYGLYRSTNGGQTWKLRSDAHDFQFVFWHPDGTLYALADKNGFVNPTHVYRSGDDGTVWEDITHGLNNAGYGGLTSIFRDPDHPALVCLAAQGVRGYVIHAEDGTYRWHGEQETQWEQKHQSDEKFLATQYEFTGIDSISDYQFAATFGNYFAGPFGNLTRIDAFELRAEKSEYTFDLNGPKPVRATIRFRPTDHPAISYDIDGATDFWGLRLIDPAARQIAVAPKVEERANNDKGAQQEYEQRKDLRRVELTKERSYTREVDLDKLFAFPAPGVYRVQLVYANPWWAAEGRAHWTGSFGGNMIKITIK